MKKHTKNGYFKWDIAISLCSQDIEFARKLVKALNPSLKIFFYEDRQEELINKSGPESFAKTFKEQSRIVVILSRKEWSETFYTNIERNAIIDRINNGFNFLFVIPMVKEEIPAWYPSTRIYADIRRFTIDQIANFIEFIVAETGGIIIPLTVEDLYQNLISRIDEKKSIIRSQEEPSAIDMARSELEILRKILNEKIETLRHCNIVSTSILAFNNVSNIALFGLNKYILECEIQLPDEARNKIVTTQDFCISLKLLRDLGNPEAREVIDKEQRIFYYTPQLKGWSIRHLYEQASEHEHIVLFRNRNNSQFYDLTYPISTLSLIDLWFQKLFKISTKSIERYT